MRLAELRSRLPRPVRPRAEVPTGTVSRARLSRPALTPCACPGPAGPVSPLPHRPPRDATGSGHHRLVPRERPLLLSRRRARGLLAGPHAGPAGRLHSDPSRPLSPEVRVETRPTRDLPWARGRQWQALDRWVVKPQLAPCPTRELCTHGPSWSTCCCHEVARASYKMLFNFNFSSLTRE